MLISHLAESLWRRVGELQSDIIALGIHRDHFNTTDTPSFLTECRRKTYAKAFYEDKLLASILNHPPRLSSRYADANWPLDLTEEETFTSSAAFAEAKKSLDSAGWSTKNKYCTATWLRIRRMVSEVRERVFEYHYCSDTELNFSGLRYDLRVQFRSSATDS